MNEQIHDDEPDTSERVVRALLAAECPHWANSPIDYLKTSGTDNAMWRVQLADEPNVVIRLPRRPNAAAGVKQELAVLQQLANHRAGSTVLTPLVRHVGCPTSSFRTTGPRSNGSTDPTPGAHATNSAPAIS